MDLSQQQLPIKGYIYEYLVSHRKGSDSLTLTAEQYEVVKTLPEFIGPVVENDFGQIARMKIILK